MGKGHLCSQSCDFRFATDCAFLWRHARKPISCRQIASTIFAKISGFAGDLCHRNCVKFQWVPAPLVNGSDGSTWALAPQPTPNSVLKTTNFVSMWCPGWKFPQILGLRFGHVDHPQGPTCTARACRVWTCKSPGNSGYVRFILSQKKGNLLVAQPDWIYLKDTAQLGFTISSRDAESCSTWWKPWLVFACCDIKTTSD